jgi:hypothetical protein
MTMTKPALVWALLYLGFVAPSVCAQTARDYYNELKAANESTKALDQYRDEFVCFDDDVKAPYFSIIAKVPDMIKMMKDANNEAEAKNLEESRFKDSLFVQRYFKGISTQELIFSPVGAEGNDFVTVFDKPFHGKTEYAFNWATGRYRLTTSATGQKKAPPAVTSYGKCELIHPSL